MLLKSYINLLELKNGDHMFNLSARDPFVSILVYSFDWEFAKEQVYSFGQVVLDFVLLVVIIPVFLLLLTVFTVDRSSQSLTVFGMTRLLPVATERPKLYIPKCIISSSCCIWIG